MIVMMLAPMLLEAGDERPPNVILIYVDDLGYGDLGTYGSKKNDTPRLDELAAGGMRFTDYYTASALCTPSRASLLSGCYPGRLNFDLFGEQKQRLVLFPGMADGLHPDEKILPEVLRERGYATGIVGKWHLGDQPEHLPTRHGFDSYFGLPYSNDMAIMPRSKQYPPLPLLRGEKVIEQQPKQPELIEKYTEESVSFINANKDKPFFLYLAHMHVHLPHYVMDRFVMNSRNGVYGGAVAAVDWSTGVLMEELKKLGLEKNTIIIFTSDNGSRVDKHGGSNGALRGNKAQTWEGGMRVPCIVRWPARIPAGSVCKELVSAMDFYPTLSGLAGVDVSKLPKFDGHDVLALWEGRDGAKMPYEKFYYFQKGALEAVRSGKWKYRVAMEGNKEVKGLYDLDTDIGEATDVSADHEGIVRELQKAMDDMRKKLGDARLKIEGEERRPKVMTPDPKPLTTFDENYPYPVPSYLLDEAG